MSNYERSLTVLEQALELLGFTECFGIGLWGLSGFDLMVDTNAECAALLPHFNADMHEVFGRAETVEELHELIARAAVNGLFKPSQVAPTAELASAELADGEHAKTNILDILSADFWVLEGDMRQLSGEDGWEYYPDSWVGVTINGQHYLHPQNLLACKIDCDDGIFYQSSKSRCDEFIKNIKAAGTIDLSEWEPYEPKAIDLEQEWRDAAAQEQFERTNLW